MIAPAEARLGVLRGFYFLARQPNMRAAFDAAAVAALRAEIGNASSSDVTAARARTLALSTLVAIGNADEAILTAAMADGAPLVRREAILGAGVIPDTAAARRLLRSGLSDNSGLVRYDALRNYVRRFAVSDGCDAAVRGIADRDPNVSLLAVDQLGTACSTHSRAVLVLDSIAMAARRSGSAWQAAAHAVTALSSVDPVKARIRLPALLSHRNMFARTYAARAAGTLRDTAALRRLARDEKTVVRTAAIEALTRVAAHAADDSYVAQLALNDSELLDALDRVTRLKSETSRDGRRALLVRAQELGDSTLAPRVRPYLRDFDPVIADAAAAAIQAWTGTRPEVSPQRLPAQRLPSFNDLAALERARVIIEMEDGAVIELRMLPFEAPTNAFRFARLARDGYFNGLTFHRIAPNFVIQGGSPGASEYSGDGPFSRDELAASNWRGTVGLSTRGRDTGDAQMYFNVIDNVRLDHDYTVYAEVVGGMEVVDALMEGATIRRIRVR
jgi:cyclophilin family peptidyl-prolyl cis-trans isomerase